MTIANVNNLGAWRSMGSHERARHVAEASLQASATVMVEHPDGHETFPVSLTDTLAQICADRRRWEPTWSAERMSTSLEMTEGRPLGVTVLVGARCSVGWMAKNTLVALAVGDTVTLQGDERLPSPLRSYYRKLRGLLPPGTLTLRNQPTSESADTALDPRGISVLRGVGPILAIHGDDGTLEWTTVLASQYLEWTRLSIPFPTSNSKEHIS